jgi:hypothetical protein
MYNPIIPYANFTQFTPALPEFYWNVYSAEQRIKHICYEICKLAKYDDYLAEQLNLDHETIQQLLNDFEKFKESGFDDYYAEQINAWVDEHMPDIIRRAVQMVFFGLTQDGYFCAYIPSEWAFVFDTDIDYNSDNYGRLEIIY